MWLRYTQERALLRSLRDRRQTRPFSRPPPGWLRGAEPQQLPRLRATSQPAGRRQVPLLRSYFVLGFHIFSMCQIVSVDYCSKRVVRDTHIILFYSRFDQTWTEGDFEKCVHFRVVSERKSQKAVFKLGLFQPSTANSPCGIRWSAERP